MGVIPPANPALTLRDKAVKERLQELRKVDNWTNWLYIGRAWGLIALSFAWAISFHQAQMAYGWSFGWNLLAWIPAIFVIGASQHQLAAATHEATHYMLFKNRTLNELASDLLCMFPLFSSTYVFRLHHLAHHQFINDPERDPDFAQLRLSGHWMNFPVSSGKMIRTLLWQLTLIPLFTYILIRAKYNSIGVDTNPYVDKARTFSGWPERIAVIHTFGFLSLMIGLSLTMPLWVVLTAAGVWSAVVFLALWSIPADRYFVTKLQPVIAPRTTMILRTMFIAAWFTAVATLATFIGRPAWTYFFTLWLVPIFTTFALFMILRQLVQHGNGDRGWLTNTRTFLVNPFIRYAVFPLGMDYHLPHHMYATVPHYNLPRLHEFLMTVPEYREQGIVVEGYFFTPHHHHPRNPTVLEVLGPEYHKGSEEVFIDDTVVSGELTGPPS